MLCSLPRFRTPKWRWARATLFCAIGWSGAFPMTHAAQKFGIEQADRQMGWWYLIFEGLSYITGAIIYAVSHETIPSFVLERLMWCKATFTRKTFPWFFRHLGQLASGLPSLCCWWCSIALGRPFEGLWLQSWSNNKKVLRVYLIIAWSSARGLSMASWSSCRVWRRLSLWRRRYSKIVLAIKSWTLYLLSNSLFDVNTLEKHLQSV